MKRGREGEGEERETDEKGSNKEGKGDAEKLIKREVGSEYGLLCFVPTPCIMNRNTSSSPLKCRTNRQQF